MPRGRKPVGPVRIDCPTPGSADALIDAAFRGWSHARHVRRVWPSPPSRGSWIDSRLNPHPPDAAHRPIDPSVRFVRLAIEQLVSDGRTVHAACRYTADRLLSLVPLDLGVDILGVPAHAVSGDTVEARHAAARQWLIDRFRKVITDHRKKSRAESA